MDLTGFNADEVEPNKPLDPIPAGWYKAVFTASEEKPTKAQTGSFLQLQGEVIDGEFSGRKFTERLNLNNPNATAVEIAQRTLSGICRAIGVMTPRNSQDLHDKPFMVKIAVTLATAQYGPGNEVKEYEPAKKGGSTAAPTQGAAPPWKRKA